MSTKFFNTSVLALTVSCIASFVGSVITPGTGDLYDTISQYLIDFLLKDSH